MDDQIKPLDWEIPEDATDETLRAFVAEVGRRFQAAIDQSIAETQAFEQKADTARRRAL